MFCVYCSDFLREFFQLVPGIFKELVIAFIAIIFRTNPIPNRTFLLVFVYCIIDGSGIRAAFIVKPMQRVYWLVYHFFNNKIKLAFLYFVFLLTTFNGINELFLQQL